MTVPSAGISGIAAVIYDTFLDIRHAISLDPHRPFVKKNMKSPMSANSINLAGNRRGGIRTHNIQILILTTLPIGLHARFTSD